MNKTILLTTLLALLVSGCTEQPKNEGVEECKMINNQSKLGISAYRIGCPEGIYRCFSTYYGLDCLKLERK